MVYASELHLARLEWLSLFLEEIRIPSEMPHLLQKTTARMAAWNPPPLVYKPAHHFWLSKDETKHQLLSMNKNIYLDICENIANL